MVFTVPFWELVVFCQNYLSIFQFSSELNLKLSIFQSPNLKSSLWGVLLRSSYLVQYCTWIDFHFFGLVRNLIYRNLNSSWDGGRWARWCNVVKEHILIQLESLHDLILCQRATVQTGMREKLLWNFLGLRCKNKALSPIYQGPFNLDEKRDPIRFQV